MWWFVVAPVGLMTTLLAWTYVLHLYYRWTLRHIPGPTPLPFFGSLFEFLRIGAPGVFAKWAQQYGPVYKVFVGPYRFVIVTDAEEIRRAFKLTNHSHFSNAVSRLLRGEARSFEDYSLLQARDQYWKTARNAWLPAFAKSSLEGYLPLMDRTAKLLVQCLEPHAAPVGGEALPAVNMYEWMGKLTLQVVGTTAFGVDFNMMKSDASKQHDGVHGASLHEHDGTQLIKACQDWFNTMRPGGATKWRFPLMLVPYLQPIIARLANWFPDSRLKQAMQARITVSKYSKAMIAKWRREHEVSNDDTVSTAEGSDVPLGPSASLSEESSGACRLPSEMLGRVPSNVPGIASGSFMGLMLAARNRTTGERLTDGQITAQAATFIVAGYETTANALAFCLYLLTSHPEAEEKLIAEVDNLGDAETLSVEELNKLTYADACLQEALRLYPPAYITTRDQEVDTVVGGVIIPKGTSVLLTLHAVHHNEAIWPRPEEFAPERFIEGAAPDLAPRMAGGHMPFGGGSRLCPGAKFALLEAKTVLLRLYQRYRFRLEPGQVPLKTRSGITMSPANGVHLHVFTR